MITSLAERVHLRSLVRSRDASTASESFFSLSFSFSFSFSFLSLLSSELFTFIYKSISCFLSSYHKCRLWLIEIWQHDTGRDRELGQTTGSQHLLDLWILIVYVIVSFWLLVKTDTEPKIFQRGEKASNSRYYIVFFPKLFQIFLKMAGG